MHVLTHNIKHINTPTHRTQSSQIAREALKVTIVLAPKSLPYYAINIVKEDSQNNTKLLINLYGSV